jgi:hypothetical protein
MENPETLADWAQERRTKDEPKINQHRKLDKDGQHGPQPKTGDECRCS